jgi:DNA-binding CsgD family transcriptional regulator
LSVMDGLSQRQIAQRLDCSPHTVDSHLRRIYRKVEVQSGASLVAKLFVAYAALCDV